MDTEYITDWEEMKAAYRRYVEEEDGEVLFHNAPFDLSVGRRWFGVEFPRWDRVHDTMYLVFLKNPHALSLSLKPSADTYLDRPPEEQDELREWILANVPGAKKGNWGAFISKGPVPLVAKYAKADALMTRQLFDKLIGEVPHEPYDRERELMPILVAATIKGVRVDRVGLAKALDASRSSKKICDQRIRAILRTPDLNVGSGAELAAALDKCGKMARWKLTPTGKKSTARDNLMAGINDPVLLRLLMYSAASETLIGTFLEPWLDKSEADGRLHPNWNQVRSPKGEKDSKGTRTGRLSSDDPNLQNVPKPFDFDIPADLAAVPEMRRFILPEEGHVWLKRDWSAQEMRILAHFEDGPLCQAYNDDPDLDVHTMVQQLIKSRVGQLFDRRFIKECGFGMIYGMGANGLAGKIGGGMTSSEARGLQDAYKVALPGVAMIQAGTKQRGRSGQAIATWGGRKYFAEEPRIIKGAYRSFEYKLTNYLIQGSAADQAKQTLIAWDRCRGVDTHFMAQVHDEMNISAPEDAWEEPMAWLKECMEKDYFDVPMRSDAFKGDTWGSIEEVEE